MRAWTAVRGPPRAWRARYGGSVAHRERVDDRVDRAPAQRATDADGLPPAREPDRPEGRRSVRVTAIWLAITGVSLYLVAPSLLDVLDSWRDVGRLNPKWLPAMLLAQVASFACLWELQRLALHGAPWGPVITSQLAGNALAKVAPGGGAVGATLQYRMLVESGLRRGETVTAITAVNVLVF